MPSKTSTTSSIADQPPLPEVAELLFGRRPGSGDDLKPYFSYYQRQWAEFSAANHTTSEFPTFNDFSDVVQKIKDGASREVILKQLEERHQAKGYPAGTLPGLIDLAAAALTMVQTSGDGAEGSAAWTSGSLQRFLAERFPDTPTLESDMIKLPHTFDASTVENMGGVMIEFTDNLADHLRLVRNGGAVLIFHHVAFLEFLDGKGGGDSLLPSQLIKETLQSLSFLFPKSEFSSFLGLGSSKGKWLKGTISTWEGKASAGGARVDYHIFRCAPLPMYGRRIESYRYWHDRLVQLKQRCDEGTVAGKPSKTGLGFTAMLALPVGNSP